MKFETVGDIALANPFILARNGIEYVVLGKGKNNRGWDVNYCLNSETKQVEELQSTEYVERIW